MATKMTWDEFLEKFQYSELDIDELSEICLNVEGEIGDIAKEYLELEQKLRTTLAKKGYRQNYED